MAEMTITAAQFNDFHARRRSDESSLVSDRVAFVNENWPTAFDHLEYLLDNGTVPMAGQLASCGIRIPYDDTVRYDPVGFDAAETTMKRFVGRHPKYANDALRAVAILREYHAQL